MSGLIDEITDQLVGSDLVADSDAGRLVIREFESRLPVILSLIAFYLFRCLVHRRQLLQERHQPADLRLLYRASALLLAVQ